MTDTTPEDPIAALLALEITQDVRDVVTEARAYAQLASAESRAGVTLGPAMARHITEGLGHPEAALAVLDMLTQFMAALPARKEEARAIQLVNERVPLMAKFIETTRAFIDERPEYITAILNGGDNDDDINRWRGGAEARRQLAERLGFTVPHNYGEKAEPVKLKEATTNA